MVIQQTCWQKSEYPMRIRRVATLLVCLIVLVVSTGCSKQKPETGNPNKKVSSADRGKADSKNNQAEKIGQGDLRWKRILKSDYQVPLMQTVYDTDMIDQLMKEVEVSQIGGPLNIQPLELPFDAGVPQAGPTTRNMVVADDFIWGWQSADGDLENTINAVEKFIADFPDHPSAAFAKERLAVLKQAQAAAQESFAQGKDFHLFDFRPAAVSSNTRFAEVWFVRSPQPKDFEFDGTVWAFYSATNDKAIGTQTYFYLPEEAQFGVLVFQVKQEGLNDYKGMSGSINLMLGLQEMGEEDRFSNTLEVPFDFR